jgi:hypothetical protein
MPQFDEERALDAPVEPCDLPDEIQLAYVDDRDRRRAVALEDAAGLDFSMAKAFRKPPAYRGQRNFPGWWWSATTRSHVLYESWLERHHVIEADRDARVVAITGQPFELTWSAGSKKQARHVPDLLCGMLGGQVVVTDCRPVSKADEKFRRKAAVTAAACSHIGWNYRLVGEPDPVWAANLRWLAGYRHPRFGDDQHGELSATLLGYLLTASGFTALDAVPPKRAPQDGRISILDEAEQKRIRWLERSHHRD